MRRVRVNLQHGKPPKRFEGWATVVSEFTFTRKSIPYTFLEVRPDGWEKHILILEGDIITPLAYAEKKRR